MGKLPDDWDVRRERVLLRDDYTCINCGEKGGLDGEANLEIHHVVPRREGGVHDISNLTTLCHSCHLKTLDGDTGRSVDIPDGNYSTNYERRAEMLEQETWLSEREAEVSALRMQGLSRDEVAEELGITTNAAYATSYRVRQKVDRCMKTLELVDKSV